MSEKYVTVRHRCEFCRRSYASVTKATRHEADCFRNPASQSCPTCVHFQPDPFTDCVLGLGSYDPQRDGWDDDPIFHWAKRCPSWVSCGGER